MLEFYYNFFDKYLNQRNFELIQIDTDLMYMAISGTSIDKIIKPELREEYHNGGKAKFLSISKYHNRAPGLFKTEFPGMRMIVLMSKCYYTEDAKSRTLSVGREALNGSIDRASNTGFQLDSLGILTYTQFKLGLIAYYDKISGSS